MKSFKSVLFGLALLLMVGSVFADCLATKAQALPAQKIKEKAITARDNADFDTAAQLFEEASAKHPQEAYSASYLMNSVGCLLSAHLDKWGGYSWDKKRGKANAQKAYRLLDRVQKLLDTASSEKCSYTSGVIQATQNWHDKQLKFLSSQVVRIDSVKLDANGNILN